MKLRRILWQILFIVFLSCLIGFSVNYSLIRKYFKGEFSQGFISLEKYSGISFITLVETEALFVSQDALFIDSRDRSKYASGHILEALNIPYEEKGDELDLEEYYLPGQSILVVYCDGSECQSSIHLAKLLHEYGFRDIRVFFGGWRDWVDAGLPTMKK